MKRKCPSIEEQTISKFPKYDSSNKGISKVADINMDNNNCIYYRDIFISICSKFDKLEHIIRLEILSKHHQYLIQSDFFIYNIMVFRISVVRIKYILSLHNFKRIDLKNMDIDDN